MSAPIRSTFESECGESIAAHSNCLRSPSPAAQRVDLSHKGEVVHKLPESRNHRGTALPSALAGEGVCRANEGGRSYVYWPPARAQGWITGAACASLFNPLSPFAPSPAAQARRPRIKYGVGSLQGERWSQLTPVARREAIRRGVAVLGLFLPAHAHCARVHRRSRIAKPGNPLPPANVFSRHPQLAPPDAVPHRLRQR